MEPKIHTLTIERFRAIRKLSIENLGRVNLITGKNNTGKSSVLEALRLLASGASTDVIRNILQFREEYGEDIGSSRPLDEEGFFQFSGLFHGFPTFSGEIEPIVIESRGGQVPLKLSIGTVWIRWQEDSEGMNRPITQKTPSLFPEEDLSPAIEVNDISGKPRYLTRDSLRRPPFSFRQAAEESRMPCVFVSPYGGERTATLGSLWDKIALSEGEKAVVEALRIISPEISAVSMVGGEAPRQVRKAIVRAEGIPRPVPLRTFGDGLNRLFGIALSLVNAKDGLLLIDEFENGMHHTIQVDVWRAIFRLAKNLDIQVVATSHSWDSIEAFQKAASEDPEEGVLIRLTRKGQDIIPTVLSEDELAIAARDRIEVR
jgi:hypothetical protein